jgi:hypothetical protein
MISFISFYTHGLLRIFRVLINSPIVHLFIEHVFGILILELWEYFPVISEVVDECFEGFTISV